MIFTCDVIGATTEICNNVCEVGLNCLETCPYSYDDSNAIEKQSAFEEGAKLEYN